MVHEAGGDRTPPRHERRGDDRRSLNHHASAKSRKNAFPGDGTASSDAGCIRSPLAIHWYEIASKAAFDESL
ncbi:MAG: hypothetical protein D6741_17525 [Planctomycetota bacterium]|nr:MAG: hypothetical protein D6741_17525 [Planctomycetota bacterium]